MGHCGLTRPLNFVLRYVQKASIEFFPEISLIFFMRNIAISIDLKWLKYKQKLLTFNEDDFVVLLSLLDWNVTCGAISSGSGGGTWT